MELRVLSQSFAWNTIIDIFDSLIWTDRYSAYGDFEIYTPPDSKLQSFLQEDYFLQTENSEHTMIVEDRKIDSEVENGARLIITGRSLESILDRRIIWKQTILSGNFQNGIKQLLDENIINPTITARKINNFIFVASTDPAITSLTIDAQFTGDNLYDAIKSLCEEKGLGFKIILTDDNKLAFSLYAGVNRSYDQLANPYVVFSPKNDNLLSSNYLQSKKTLKTVTLVAGEGEGSDRKTVTTACTNGEGSGLDRREMFTDARDISSTTDSGTLSTADYNAQLIQRGNEDLAKNTVTQSFEGQAEMTQMYRLGVDFFMGDIIQIANEYGVESKARVTEIVNSQSTSSIDTVPTFTNI